jgi:alpha-1,2-mannosyltransferase
MLPLALLGRDLAIAAMVALNVVAAAAVAYWLVDPVARRYGWSRWFTLGVAGCAFAAFGPVRDTVSFGQINLVLVALVWADLRFLIGRGSRFGGVGIGLAAAIKLTPALFICYLLLSRRRPAALTATATAAGATVLGGIVAAEPSRVFWTSALWQTNRVGSASYVSNQSLMGLVARLNPAHPNQLLWVTATGAVLCAWAYRARRAGRAGDDWAGFALTAVAACLVSPVTWVHHLVWLIPALVLTADRAIGESGRRRWIAVGGVATAYLVLASGVVWLWATGSAAAGVSGFVGSNVDIWLCLALLLWMPVTADPHEQRRSPTVVPLASRPPRRAR